MWPALTRLAGIRAPMLPRPMNPMFAMSEYLKDVVDGAFGQSIAGADGDDSVQPVIARRGGLEGNRGAEVILRRIDELTGIYLFHHRGGSVPHPAIGHADAGAIVRLQHEAHIQRGRVRS